MEINITRQNYDHLHSENKVRWTLLSKRYIMICFLYIGFGALMLTLELSLSKNDGSYWGFWTSFYLAFILLGVVYFIQYFQNKRKFFLKTDIYKNLFNQQTEGITIKITDNSITYRDFTGYSETKWVAYTHYKFHNHLLLIMGPNEYFSALTINKNELTPEQFKELSSFVATKLQPK